MPVFRNIGKKTKKITGFQFFCLLLIKCLRPRHDRDEIKILGSCCTYTCLTNFLIIFIIFTENGRLSINSPGVFTDRLVGRQINFRSPRALNVYFFVNTRVVLNK